jgi:hypothetical protein
MMPDSNGCYTTPEVSAKLGGAPDSLIRRIVDRLGLGVRVNNCRIVFTEDLDTIATVLKGMGKLPGMELVPKKKQAELVQEELLKWQAAQEEPLDSIQSEPLDSINGEVPLEPNPLDSINKEVPLEPIQSELAELEPLEPELLDSINGEAP